MTKLNPGTPEPTPLVLITVRQAMNLVGTPSSLKKQKLDIYKKLGHVSRMMGSTGGLRTFQLEPIQTERANCENNEVVGVIHDNGFDCIANLLIKLSDRFLDELRVTADDNFMHDPSEIEEVFPGDHVNTNWSVIGGHGADRTDGLRSAIFGRASRNAEDGFAGAFGYRQQHLMASRQWQEYELLTRGINMYGFFGDWKFEIEAPRFTPIHQCK